MGIGKGNKNPNTGRPKLESVNVPITPEQHRAQAEMRKFPLQADNNHILHYHYIYLRLCDVIA